MSDLEKRNAPVLAEVVPIGWRAIDVTEIEVGDMVKWYKGRTWQTVVRVIEGRPLLLETSLDGKDRRGTVGHVRRAIRHEVAR